jgi:hypothetical protein
MTFRTNRQGLITTHSAFPGKAQESGIAAGRNGEMSLTPGRSIHHDQIGRINRSTQWLTAISSAN